MKYKVLLTGKNDTIINDFFTHLSGDFEAMTTSGRSEDMINHLKYFQPDIFVYCMDRRVKSYMNEMFKVKQWLDDNKIPFAIIGSEEDCNNFSQYSVIAADLVLIKPITVSTILEKVSGFLKEWQHLKEEARIEAERIETERRRLEEASRRRHVLVVDDDPLMLKLIKEHLHDKYDVATANSGKTALRFLEKKKTDLILLDYQMPLEDGPAILEKIHANDETKDIPVVFLTGISQREKIQKALVQNPQGYLLKPIDRDKLLEAISKLIG